LELDIFSAHAPIINSWNQLPDWLRILKRFRIFPNRLKEEDPCQEFVSSVFSKLCVDTESLPVPDTS